MKHALLLILAAALLVAGCGGDSAEEATTPVKVYLLRDGKVWPVARVVSEGDTATATTGALLEGPTDDERELGYTSEASDVPASELSRAGLAQLVYTASQFSGDTAVIEGTTYARADFEEQTPSVLVESPLSFEEVTSPITAAGTANTFEANFQYELLDADGNVIDENFVTATSGTGTRGTFEFTTDAVDDVAALVVFESSAEDGSRMNEIEIPLNAAP